MIRDTGADYKKAIVAVAIAGGVGATVAGAGLLAYRLWRRRTCCGREKKSDKQSDPVHTVSKTRSWNDLCFDQHQIYKCGALFGSQHGYE